MPDPTGVLVVGHDASRTGAPAVGLAFVRWLVASGAADVRVALVRGGPLAADLEQLAPVRVLDAGWRAPAARLADGLSGAGGPPVLGRALDRLRHGSPARHQVVLANSLAALPAAVALAGRARLTCWVHELDGVAARVLRADRREALLDRVDHVVAAGDRVGAIVVERWGVAPERVTIVDEFLDDLVPAPAHPPRSELDVLGAGSLTPRKGVDAFVSTFAVLARERSDRRGAWAGGPPDGVVAAEAAHDLARAGLADRVRFLGEVPDLEPWWPERGVLLHAPREDPFPLVVIEAGARSVPVVTWDTGGAADLLRRAGLDDLVAPPGDVLGLARRVAHLLDDDGAHRRAADALHRVAADLVASRQAPAVWAACTGAPR